MQFTREKMLSVFQDLFGTSRLRAARNWCLVTEQPDGALQFQVCSGMELGRRIRRTKGSCVRCTMSVRCAETALLR